MNLSHYTWFKGHCRLRPVLRGPVTELVSQWLAHADGWNYTSGWSSIQQLRMAADLRLVIAFCKDELHRVYVLVAVLV